MKLSKTLLAAVAASLVPGASFADTTLFSDDFNTGGSSVNYTTAASNPSTSFATFGYDYSVLGIPSAPHSGDASTKGLRLEANTAAPAAIGAVNVYTALSFTGDYRVRFDAWLNVNGDFPDGGSGSTQYLTTGVGSDGSTINLVANTGKGGWFAVNGENGSGIDYRLYKNGTLQGVATGQYGAGTASDARSGANAYYSQFGNLDIATFPVQGANNGGPAQQTGISAVGSFGMAWHDVILDVDADGGTGGAASMKVTVDGLVIGTLDAGANGAFTSDGKLNFGFSDPSSNNADNPSLLFGVIDNLVVSVPEPSTYALVAMGGLSMLALRRRRS